MRSKFHFYMLLTVLVCIALGCNKDLPLEAVSDSYTTAVAHAKAEKPRFRAKHHYGGLGNCDGGICGRCIGICAYVEFTIGGEPTPEELAEGVSRVELVVDGRDVLFTPIDLPMDPGTGKALLADVLRADPDVASYLGYSRVELAAGTYEVDYSNGDRYGRIRVPATLVP